MDFTKEFQKLKKELDEYDSARERVIKDSRDVLKAAKQAIFSLHRGDHEKARALLEKAREQKARIEEGMTSESLKKGIFSDASEELAEALAFKQYLTDGTLLSYEESGVGAEEYLAGIADLTGELARRVVILATERDVDGVRKIKEFIESLYGSFVQFDFRNGDLRRKYDSIKYNLQKAERALYDLEVRA